MERSGSPQDPVVVAPSIPSGLIREVEAQARRAWPALEAAPLEGWILRAAEGATRRSNSVHPIGPVADLERTLARACAWYDARGLPSRFYLTPVSVPEDLDARLAARGWARETGALVQWADLPLAEGAGAAPADPPEVRTRIEGAVGDEWFERFAAWRDLDAPSRASHRKILARVPERPAFATVGDGEPRAAGLAVCDGEWVGLFDLIVAPTARRRGWGRALVRSLLAWGLNAGARRAYLQVDDANTPAIALYEAMGFRTAYAYSYRRRPEAGGDPANR